MYEKEFILLTEDTAVLHVRGNTKWLSIPNVSKKKVEKEILFSNVELILFAYDFPP